MEWLLYVLSILGIAIVLILLTSFICFLKVFYSPKRKLPGPDEYEIPEGEIYEVYREQMTGWIKSIRTMPHEDISIKSFDGLTLRGKYYEYKKGAPIELQFHGYRGYGERDLCGGVERCFALERNVIVIDHRASGTSDGHVISFGINERKDCLRWIDRTMEKFGKDVKIIITGVSMGAATVVMASGMELPKNVICVLADCGYSSAKEIIMKVVADMKLPPRLLYPFIKLGARIFGGFDLEEDSPVSAVKRCRIPLIMFHGDQDDFVPFEMSEKVFKACPHQNKRLVKISGAGHGLAYPADREGYVREMKETVKEWNL
ncbi:MAG: alpha/beta hydrolase [Ruminococcaceae bacterium]|nr:alpha/beta hydrolase [Oscillospiraceae bacterium]